MKTGALLKVVGSARCWRTERGRRTNSMNTKTSGTKESIDTRTRKAATESMTVVDLEEAGEYKVYSGTRKSYVVDLVNETCECPSAEYQSGPCKHRRRCLMALGQLEIPDLGARRLDVEIMSGRSRETETRVATDGGTVLDDTPQDSTAETTHAPGCDNPECEGIDADVDRPLLSWEC